MTESRRDLLAQEGAGLKGSRPQAAALLSPEQLPPADVVLDTVGLYCPVPIIKTQARIRSMRPGEILEVVSDDRVILLDMPAWCRSTGHDYLGALEESGELRLLVRKVGRGGGLTDAPPGRR